MSREPGHFDTPGWREDPKTEARTAETSLGAGARETAGSV